MQHECFSLVQLEPPDERGECEAIRRCGEHVYQFTRLDDGTFMATHRVAGGKPEILASVVRGSTAYAAVMEHHRATHEAEQM